MKIRRLQKEDLQTRVDWMNNPKVYSSMHFGIPVVMENTVRRMGSLSCKLKSAIRISRKIHTIPHQFLYNIL